MKLKLLKREAETGGLKMYSADGVYLPLPQEAAVADAADGAIDDAPDAEDYDYNSDANSIIGGGGESGAAEAGGRDWWP